MPKQWLERAVEDLVVAQLLLDEEHFSHACFLSQPSMEKAPKALLLHVTGACPRTHRLVDLLIEAATSEQSLLNLLADCAIVDQYYFPTRYPDSLPGGLATGLPGKVEAREAVEIAERLLTAITPKLPQENEREKTDSEEKVDDE
ncbi:MAG: HEPN domain-containing protein [Caldilineaceae bacterium]|nr:HEPN domain-containing protein [Caldilineaceae bacterium]